MILILSMCQDESTNDVIDWLYHYEKQFIRLDGENYRDGDYQLSFSLDNNSNNTFLIDGNDLKTIKSVWFRRWIPYKESFNDIIKELEEDGDSELTSNFKNHLINEMRKSYRFVFNELSSPSREVNWLPKYSSSIINKMDILKKAVECGLKVPVSLVCNRKKELQEFKSKYHKIITKPLSEVFNFNLGNYNYFCLTEIITENTIKGLNDVFFPSLFQQYIEKEIELRVFYLNGRFYPMAIFSQLDSTTTVDFRNYNRENPNRNVPFKLPIIVEERLSRLMFILDLNTGSIDLILTKDNEYYFLEVNPVGQFGMTSHPCNYYLEKEIAKTL